MDSSVDESALPSGCKKMKHALLTQARIIMHRYVRKALMAKIGVVAALVGCAENGDELPGKALRQHKRHRAHQRLSHPAAW